MLGSAAARSAANLWASPTVPPNQTQKRIAAQPLTHLIVHAPSKHNLKNINVEIPRDQMTVCCGNSEPVRANRRSPWDTIFAEGQRRCMSNRCPPTLANFWARCRSRRSSTSAVFPRQSASNNRRPAKSLAARLSAPLPRFTTTCASSSPGSGQPYCPKCEHADRHAGLPTRSSKKS